MPLITIRLQQGQLNKLQKFLTKQGYQVENPVEMIKLLVQDDMNDLEFYVGTTKLDDGSNNLIGDVLTDAEAEQCGAKSDVEDDE